MMTDLLPDPDKWQHFTASALMFVLDLWVRLRAKRHPNTKLCAFYAFRDVMLLGFLKEGIDALGFGNVESADLVADVLGILFPVFLWQAWNESTRIADEELLTHGMPALRMLFRSAGNEERSLVRLMVAAFRVSLPKDHSDRLYRQMEARRAIAEYRTATARLGKTFLYGSYFLLHSSVEFCLDLLRMPLWSMVKTLLFGKEAMLYLISRPPRKRR